MKKNEKKKSKRKRKNKEIEAEILKKGNDKKGR